MSISQEERVFVLDALHQFYQTVDNGHAEKTVDMFAPDARVVFGPGTPNPGTVEGEAVRAAMVARGAQKHVTTRHVLANTILSRNPDGAITASSILTLYRSDNGVGEPAPLFVCDVAETFVQIDGAWKIRERNIMPIFLKKA